MTNLAAAIDALLAEHDAMGSPLRRYLRRSGSSEQAIRKALFDVALAVEVVEFFGLQNGVNQRGWQRDAGGPVLEMFWGGEPLGLDASVAERTRRLELNSLYPSAEEGWRDPGEVWPARFVPIFRSGGSLYAAECGPSSTAGRIWLIHPAPVVDPDRSRPVFASLGEFLSAAVERLRGRFYYWDPASQSVQAASQFQPWLTSETPPEPDAPHTATELLERAVAAIEAFARREGHVDVPIAHVAWDGLLLGAVVTSLRNGRADLSPDVVARLERLPGWRWTQ